MTGLSKPFSNVFLKQHFKWCLFGKLQSRQGERVRQFCQWVSPTPDGNLPTRVSAAQRSVGNKNILGLVSDKNSYVYKSQIIKSITRFHSVRKVLAKERSTSDQEIEANNCTPLTLVCTSKYKTRPWSQTLKIFFQTFSLDKDWLNAPWTLLVMTILWFMYPHFTQVLKFQDFVWNLPGTNILSCLQFWSKFTQITTI